eukprot:4039396-Pyramimonas_sp.AAC.1
MRREVLTWSGTRARSTKRRCKMIKRVFRAFVFTLEKAFSCAPSSAAREQSSKRPGGYLVDGLPPDPSTL